jgi:hypothetical protein
MAKNQPTKAGKREAPARPPKPQKKGGKERQPLNREERRKAAWLRKTKRKVAEQTLTEVGTKASAGLTYAQLEASGLIARQSRPAGPTFKQTLLEVVAEQARQSKAAAETDSGSSELEKSARLELIEEATVEQIRQAAAEETHLLEIARQLSAAPPKISPVFAELIEEGKKAAEVQRRERVAFRQELSKKLRQRKEREGRGFSDSPDESGDEELIRFLFSHRSDLAAMRDFLPLHLQEEIERFLEEEAQKGPLKREIAKAADAARRQWDELKDRLVAGAADPENTVAQNAAAMRSLLGVFAQIKALHRRLAEPIQPQPDAANTPKKYRDKSWRGNAALALALKAALA